MAFYFHSDVGIYADVESDMLETLARLEEPLEVRPFVGVMVSQKETQIEHIDLERYAVAAWINRTLSDLADVNGIRITKTPVLHDKCDSPITIRFGYSTFLTVVERDPIAYHPACALAGTGERTYELVKIHNQSRMPVVETVFELPAYKILNIANGLDYLNLKSLNKLVGEMDDLALAVRTNRGNSRKPILQAKPLSVRYVRYDKDTNELRFTLRRDIIVDIADCSNSAKEIDTMFTIPNDHCVWREIYARQGT